MQAAATPITELKTFSSDEAAMKKMLNRWHAMRQRCNNPNAVSFPNYGGRGIAVCERWATSFENFLADVGMPPAPGLSLDRIDNDGHYEPGNVRWATAKQQAANRCAGISTTVDGEALTLAEGAARFGLKYDTVWQRHLAGRRGADLFLPPDHGRRFK